MKSFVGKIILLALFVLSLGCGSPEIGLGKKGLGTCPASPNCVVSIGGDEDHHIAPILYRSGRAEARERIKDILSKMEGVRLVTDRPDYIHIESRSRVMKFVDDVEFWFPETGKIIHVRSASRLGYSDFGVNRERIEKIRTRFQDGPALNKD